MFYYNSWRLYIENAQRLLKIEQFQDIGKAISIKKFEKFFMPLWQDDTHVLLTLIKIDSNETFTVIDTR